MKKRAAVSFFALSAAFQALPARATSDAIYKQIIVSQDPQSGDFCLTKMPIWGVFGDAAWLALRGVFTPYNVPYLTGSGVVGLVKNINVTATQPELNTSLGALESTSYSVYEYGGEVDVSAYVRSRQGDASSLQTAVNTIKLALVAMAKNLDAVSDGKFRLTVTFIGLPSQQGLVGTPLYAKTNSPYSKASPLLKAYEKELLNQTDSCKYTF